MFMILADPKKYEVHDIASTKTVGFEIPQDLDLSEWRYVAPVARVFSNSLGSTSGNDTVDVVAYPRWLDDNDPQTGTSAGRKFAELQTHDVAGAVSA